MTLCPTPLPRLFRTSAAFIFALLLALAATTSARAITSEDLLPENLVGKTFNITKAVGNTLEPSITGYTVLFTSASTYTRTLSNGQSWSGTYTVLSSTIEVTGRLTSLLINTNWLGTGNTTIASLGLIQNGTGSNVAGFAGGAITFTIGAGDGTPTTAGLGAGLIAYYKFENNLTDSAGSNHGAWVNSTGVYAASRSGFGSAGSFSGVNQFVAIPHNSTFNVSTAGLTVSLWVNTTNPKSATGGSRLVDKQTPGSADGWIFDTYDIARQSRNVLRVASTNIGVNSTSTFATSQWQHLVFAYSGGTVTYYVNGTAAGSGAVGTLVNNSLPLQLGAPHGTTVNAEYFSGLMDEVRIYNRVLSPTEITALAGGSTDVTGLGAAIVAGAPANLVGYRGKVGAAYQFSVTGATGGGVWGTDVYTDDSNVATAAVHAGVLRVGETKTVTVTILAGQNAYTASTRNGVASASWGAWTGSYSFAGAGAVSTAPAATALPAAAPGFVAGTSTLTVGGRLLIPVTVTGGGTYTYRWYLNGVLIAGATSNPYIVDAVTSANSGTYAADVTNSFGTTRIAAGTVTINATGAPTFNLQPFDKVVAPGGVFALAADADGSGLAYQWFRNGVALAGETGPVLLRQNVNTSDAGSYTVRVTNSAGAVTSAPSAVTLSATASTLRNISVRTNAAATQIVIPGITVSGTGSKRVIIRAVGPGLSQFGLTGVMTDPKLAVYDGNTKIAESDNWDGTTATANAFAAVGAFGLAAGSKDAALVTNLTASASGRGYTIQVSSANAQGGIVLIEVYDADTAPTSKLSNVSVRSISAPGANVLIMGLTLQGTGKRTLLIRGIGPTLASFGVSGTLVDPKLTIFDSNSRELLTNNDWSNADFVAEMVQAQNFVAAFALQAGSKDSSTLALLDAGGYTLQIAGNDGGTGEALAEVYEIP